MKNIKLKLYFVPLMVGIMLSSISCDSNLLDQEPTTQLGTNSFWKTPSDALYAITGVYADIRTIYAQDYYFDGAGEFQYTHTATTLGKGSWSPGANMGSSFDYMWNNCYAAIDHANYTIENINKMLVETESTTDKSSLERILGEARFLRGLAYFRLIEMWGDVPYMDRVYTMSEVSTLSRTPIGVIKDSIYSDFTFAIEKLPAPKAMTSSEAGRATKAAAYGFRGKLQLYWASWNKFGWPELTTFTPNAEQAAKAYSGAATDLAHVIDDFGISLFRNGASGTAQDPAYFYLFQTENETDDEIIFSVCFAGPLLFQGEYMMRDFGTRNNFGGQCRLQPTYRLTDRYQLISTGDFAPAKLVLNKSVTTINGASNPKSYEGRDYRMRATMLWDMQKIIPIDVSGLIVGDSIPFRFGYKDGVKYINYDATITGYLYRKWIRYKAGLGLRGDGPQDFYLMRLADVFLMYAEASNFAVGPTTKAIDLVNKVRARGALPNLPAKYTDSQDSFFKAIEQERIVELISEGHRFFDIRRWRKATEIWGAPGGEGQILYNTWGVRMRDEFLAAPAKEYERYYIGRIPLSELERNTNLRQNECWY